MRRSSRSLHRLDAAASGQRNAGWAGTMFIEKLAPARRAAALFLQYRRYSCRREEVLVLADLDKQARNRDVFEPGQRPGCRRNREFDIGGRGAERSHLRSNKYSDVIEIGRFPHAWILVSTKREFTKRILWSSLVMTIASFRISRTASIRVSHSGFSVTRDHDCSFMKV
jgi:hypothetical protein